MQKSSLNSPFVVAVVTIWAAWIVINFTQRIYYADNPGDVAFLWMKVRAIQGINGMWATVLLFAAYDRILKETSHFYRKAVGVALLTYLFSLALVLINQTVYQYFFQKAPLILPLQRYLVIAFSKYFIILGLSIFYFLILHWQALQRQKEKTLTAVALANEAQLQMLRYQLNPHFLFNALNSIRTLVHEAPEKADRIITDLSEFLRYSLSSGNGHVVPLSDELEVIQNYLKIQKIRFEERLETRLEVSSASLGFEVPCFLIHPLVENAVKYGLETSPPPLKIRVRAFIEGRTLEVRVENTGRLNSDRRLNGLGTGLNNVRLRLRHFFPERNTFRLYENEGQVHAVIKASLPIRHDRHGQKGDDE